MKSFLLRPIFVCGVLATVIHPAPAVTPGDLDLTFGSSGKVTTPINDLAQDTGRSVALQNDGKIVVAGQANIAGESAFALVRYNKNGSLDTTFNGSGKVTTDIGTYGEQSYGVAVQSDGKIVAAGWNLVGGSAADFAVVRYNANGSLDTSFGGTGKVTTSIGSTDDGTSLAVQSDGKIVVAGSSWNGSNHDFALVRYNIDGSLDTTFNGSGKVTTAIGSAWDQAHSVAIQSDGKILAAGYSVNASNLSLFALVRYNPNGSLDTTFDGTGKVTTNIAGSNAAGNSMAIQSDGKIVVAGSVVGSNYDFAVVRYSPNGSLDTTFNGTGKVTTAIGASSDDYGNSVALDHDGRIVVAGHSSSSGGSKFALVRYNPDGSLDTTFNGSGKVTTGVGFGGYGYGVAVQSDGKLVVAGYSINGSSDFAVVRYEGSDPDADRDGIADRFETGTGIYVSPQDTGTSPTNPDTDGDGLSDGQEVNTYLSNPNIVDTDGDGFGDGFEVNTGFNPTSAASTPDALSSIRTAVEYRFNAADGISYRIESSTDLVNWVTVETNIIGTGGVITRFYSIEGQPKRFYRSRRN